MSKKGKLLVLFTAVVSSVFVSLLFLEVTLRLFQLKTQTRTTITWKDDEKVGRRLNPLQTGLFVSNTREYRTEVSINSQGFRDTEHDIEKKAFRIVLLGDSFVENFQVPIADTIFKQIEKALSQRLGKPVEVIAMGLGDTGQGQQYLLLKDQGMQYKPDLVVQLFFSANDVKNNSKTLMGDPYRPYFTVKDDQLKLLPFETRSISFIKRLVIFLKNNIRIVEFILDAKGKLLANKGGFPIDYDIYKKVSSREYEEGWNITEKLIIETKKLAEENASKYMLVSLANNEQVNFEVQNKITQKFPQLKGTDYDFIAPDIHLQAFCNKEQISCTYMYPFFANFVKTHPRDITHYPFDGHFNEVGTNLAAEFLTEVITNYLVNK